MKGGFNKFAGLAIFAIMTLAIMTMNLSYAQELDDEGKLIGKWQFVMKCGKCHSIERPLSKRKSQEEWELTVKTMHKRAHGWIEDKQVKEIVHFLSSKSLFEEKCTGCHSDDRALDLIKNKEDWTKTVNFMQKKKSGWISDKEAEQIIIYLFSVQGGE
jgi:hypothetical protein